MKWEKSARTEYRVSFQVDENVLESGGGFPSLHIL